MAEHFENLQVRLAVPGAAKRNGRIQIRPGESDLVFQTVANFLKGRLERRFEGRVVILLERFLRDKERDDFSFRDLDARENW